MNDLENTSEKYYFIYNTTAKFTVYKSKDESFEEREKLGDYLNQIRKAFPESEFIVYERKQFIQNKETTW